MIHLGGQRDRSWMPLNIRRPGHVDADVGRDTPYFISVLAPQSDRSEVDWPTAAEATWLSAQS